MTERELLKILSGNIKLYRGQNKWTQAELAEKLNISINFLSDIETGKKWASPVNLVKIADLFSLNVYELLMPTNILPDNLNPFLEKYTKDIFSALNEVHDTYLTKIKKEKKKRKA